MAEGGGRQCRARRVRLGRGRNQALGKKPVAEGGWNIFITWGSGEGFDNPIGFVAHTANGGDGWFGWPKDDLHEKLRDDWALAATLEERKAVARKLQENAWNYVPMALLGQWAPPVARRANRHGFIPFPATCPSGMSRRLEDERSALPERR